VDTQIVVALIAAGGLLTANLLAAFLLNRQKAKDLRSNIEREIDIVRKLQPGSDETVKLERHISRSIDDLIAREERRAQSSVTWWKIGAMAAVTFSIVGLVLWRERGVPERFHVTVEVAYWALWVTYAVFIGQAIVALYRVVKPVVDLGVNGVRLLKARARLLLINRTIKASERRIKEAQARIDALQAEFQMRREYSKYVVAVLEENKDAYIAKHGQQHWDDMMAERARLDAMGDEIEMLMRDEEEPEEPRESDRI
jgi:hypothetical protein